MNRGTVLVTGASGFIGGHLARLLLESGSEVRALTRGRSRNPILDGRLPIDWRRGDLRDRLSVAHAVQGCSQVYHVAADYRIWARNPRELYASNVTGTRHVLKAAFELGVSKVVYTSSVGTLGHNPDGTPADEKTPVSLDDMVGHYKRSKFLAEQEALEFAAKGLAVTLVHPSTPVGPGDHKPTPTGRIIVDFLNGRMPAFLDTGLNLIHVQDVAAGHLAAMDLGRIGEKYILGNRNLSLADILKLLSQISDQPAPAYRLPFRPVLWAAYVNEIISRLTGRPPLIPLDGVKMARKEMYFDSTKAVAELKLPQTPIEQALGEAVLWYIENGYVRRSL